MNNMESFIHKKFIHLKNLILDNIMVTIQRTPIDDASVKLIGKFNLDNLKSTSNLKDFLDITIEILKYPSRIEALAVFDSFNNYAKCKFNCHPYFVKPLF